MMNLKEVNVIVYSNAILTSFENVHHMVLDILEVLNANGLVDPKKIFKINFMLREILNNAVEHGNKMDEHKKVYCRVEKKESRFLFFVKDEGEGFDFHEVSESNLDMEDPLSHRTRGYSTIAAMGFDVSYKDKEVIVEIESKEAEDEK